MRLVEPHLLALLENSATAGHVLDAARRVRDTYDAAGQWADALPFAAELVESASASVSREGAAEDFVTVADSIALGKIIHMSGDFAGAEPVLKRALDAATALAEKAPLLQADACVQLSLCYAKGGRNAEAIQLLHRAGEIRHRILGPTHADTAEVLLTEVDSHYLMGNYGISLRVARQLMDLVPSLHGERSGVIAITAPLISATAMRKAKESRSPESPWRTVGATSAADDIAYLEAQELDWSLVWERAQEALGAHISHFGPDHPQTASARYNLALAALGVRRSGSGDFRAQENGRYPGGALGGGAPVDHHGQRGLGPLPGTTGRHRRGSCAGGESLRCCTPHSWPPAFHHSAVCRRPQGDLLVKWSGK